MRRRVTEITLRTAPVTPTPAAAPDCNFPAAHVFLGLMRSFLVGLLLLAISAPAFGQAAGYVEAIGFGKTYRPYGWTPLLVNLTSTSTSGKAEDYLIQVVQEDLDRDRVT